MEWIHLLSAKRLGEKKQKNGLIRSPFEQDYDRLIFSYPFRRLQDKTQVFPIPQHDFVHTRLTHSLEVSCVGRSLGKKAGEILLQRHRDIQKQHLTASDFGAIVAAASLAHDLGNPPFGHAGEDALSDFFLNNKAGLLFKSQVNEKEWHDLTHFEGNAQGFRILNKKNYQGLRLTAATLAAFSKYPGEVLVKPLDKQRKSQKKFGFFQTERFIFEELANELGLKKLSSDKHMVWCRHPLTFLVEAADDICYQIIDLEDGCRMGLVPFEQTKNLLASILGEKYDPQKLNKIKDTNEKIGVLRALAINELVNQVTEIFLAYEKDICSGEFDRGLTSLIQAKTTLDEIKEVSVEKIYRSRHVLETEAAGFNVIAGLLEAFTAAVYQLKYGKITKRNQSLIRLLPADIMGGDNIYESLRNCLDFLSDMTDKHAISLYRKIKGISLINY